MTAPIQDDRHATPKPLAHRVVWALIFAFVGVSIIASIIMGFRIGFL